MNDSDPIIHVRGILERRGISGDKLKEFLMLYGKDRLRELEETSLDKQAIAERNARAARQVIAACPDLFPTKN